MSTTGKEVAVIESGKQKFRMVSRFLERFIPYPYTNKQFVAVVALVVLFAIVETFLLFAAASHGTNPTEVSIARSNFSDAAAARIGWGVVLLAIWPAIRLIRHKAVVGGVLLLAVVLVVFLGTSFWFRLASLNDYAEGTWKVPGIGPFLPFVGLLVLAVLIFWIGTAGSRKGNSVDDSVDDELKGLRTKETNERALLATYDGIVKSADQEEIDAKEKLAEATKKTEACLKARKDFEEADKTVPDAEAAQTKAQEDRDEQSAKVEDLKKDINFIGGTDRAANRLLENATKQVEISDRLASDPTNKALKAQLKALESSHASIEKLQGEFATLKRLDDTLQTKKEAAEETLKIRNKHSIVVSHETAKEEGVEIQKTWEEKKQASDSARSNQTSQQQKVTAASKAMETRVDKLAVDKAALANHEEGNKVEGGLWYLIAFVLGMVAVTALPIWEGYSALN